MFLLNISIYQLHVSIKYIDLSITCFYQLYGIYQSHVIIKYMNYSNYTNL